MTAPSTLSSYVFPTATDANTVATMLSQIDSLVNNALVTYNQLNQLASASNLLVSNASTGASYPITISTEVQAIQSVLNQEVTAFVNDYGTFITNLQAYVAKL